MKKVIILSILTIFLISIRFVASDSYSPPFVQCSNNIQCSGGEICSNGQCIPPTFGGPNSQNAQPQPVQPAGNIQTSLQSYVTSSGGTVSVAGAQALPSGQQMNCFINKSCYILQSGDCYPLGYVIGKTYCSNTIIQSDTYAFLNQSQEGQSCTQNYECTTGICSDNVCVNITKIISEYNQLKIQLENLNQSHNSNNQTNNSRNNTNNLLTGKVVNNQNNNIFDNILNFFKRLFS